MFYQLSDLFDLSHTSHAAMLEGCEFPWDPLKRLKAHLASRMTRERNHLEMGQVFIGPEVTIGEGTVIEHGAVILGPAIIGKNCKIRAGAYLREDVIVGDDCVVGNSCELKHSLLFNNCQVPHFNYVGDSILGYKAHLGAGAILSNVKITPDNVWIEMDGRHFDTGLRKFGALLGDRTDIGCNAVLNPGSIIGRGAVVYPNISWRGILPDNMIAKNRAAQEVVVRRPRGV